MIGFMFLTLEYRLNLTPSTSRRIGRKVILGVTHLTNTIGIGMASYAGESDEGASGGVKNTMLNKIGNCLLFLVMVAVLFWLWPVGKRVFSARHDANYKAAKALIMAAGPATVLQLIRLSYNLTYAFNRISVLDPVTGSFATRLILMFGTQLCVVIIVIVGGWFSKDARPRPQERVSSESTEMNDASTNLV